MKSHLGQTNIVSKTTTRFLSLRLTLRHLSRTSLSLCKSLLSKTLGAFFSSMDDIFFTEEDCHLFDPDYSTDRKRPFSPGFDHFDNDDEREKLFLVPFRWWKEAQSGCTDQIVGSLYTVSSDDEFQSEIMLDLKKQEVHGKRDKGEQGVPEREYALVHEALFCRALNWYSNPNKAMKESWSLSATSNYLQDLFTLKIRLSFSPETDSLLVKISSKDNLVDLFLMARSIFNTDSELLLIWDFSGQTSLFLLNEKLNLQNDPSGQPGKEILLELHVHGFSVPKKERKEEKDLSSSLLSDSGCAIGSLGLMGLQNLGNTCFMNSAIQCLVHTPQLVDYFLGDYQKDINYQNPLGMNGELALAFGDLLRKLWASGTIPVAPKKFKLKLASFAPQFSGYNQHDSQEFLAFLLDGLHEDLNRVKDKPYIESKDAEGRPDGEVAEEYWQNHLARNNSIIVDACQGQYRSMLVCPVCKKLSNTFDPFMYLTLPLPSTMSRTMTLKIIDSDWLMLPRELTVNVPEYGSLKDFTDTLSVQCSLRNDETLLVAEIYRNKLFRWLDNPSDSLALIRDSDTLVAYRMPKDSDTSPLVVFSHERLEMAKHCFGERDWKPFGVPFVTRLSDLSSGYNIRNLFLKILDPLFVTVMDDFGGANDALGVSSNENSKMEDIESHIVSDNDVGQLGCTEDDFCPDDDFKFFLAEDRFKSTEINMNEPVLIPGLTKYLDVRVHWPDKMLEKYDFSSLSPLPEVFKMEPFTRKLQDSVSLYKCLEAFLQEEPLGPDDMWFCPNCKKHQQANKKLDLWRLPDVLVIHLKRFSYSQYLKNKIETYVDFPIQEFNLSDYISLRSSSQSCNRYRLYAISNHYGDMGGGHYTAFVDVGHGKWYEFDDGRVNMVGEDAIKTSAAYVLFYRRIAEE